MSLSHQTLGERLQNTRKNVGYSQQEVEEKTGINRSTLSKIESGDLGISSLKLRKLANLYGKSVKNLLRDEEKPEEHPDFILATRKKAPDTAKARRDIEKIEEFCENYINLDRWAEEQS